MYRQVIFNVHVRAIYSSFVKDNRALKSLNDIRDGWSNIGRKIGALVGSLEEKIKRLKVKIKSKELSLIQTLPSKKSRCKNLSIELVELEKKTKGI